MTGSSIRPVEAVRPAAAREGAMVTAAEAARKRRRSSRGSCILGFYDEILGTRDRRSVWTEKPWTGKKRTARMFDMRAVPSLQSRAAWSPVVSTGPTISPTAATVLFEHATATTTGIAAVATATATAAAVATTTAAAAAAAAAAAVTATTATTAAAAVTATAAAVTATTTTAAATLLTGACFIDGERATLEVLPVQRFDCGATTVVIHFDESEATRTSGLTIRHQMDALHFAMLLEVFAKLVFADVVREIADVDADHRDTIRVPEWRNQRGLRADPRRRDSVQSATAFATVYQSPPKNQH
jgi:hypothetical protein